MHEGGGSEAGGPPALWHQGGTVVQMGSIKLRVPPVWCCVSAPHPLGGEERGGK